MEPAPSWRYDAGNGPLADGRAEPCTRALRASGVERRRVRLNLPQNFDSPQQREFLDALPTLVFLERAGRVVFANAEARHAMGTAEPEWSQIPVEDVLWGLFP